MVFPPVAMPTTMLTSMLLLVIHSQARLRKFRNNNAFEVRAVEDERAKGQLPAITR